MGGLNDYPFYVYPFSTHPHLTQAAHLLPLSMKIVLMNMLLSLKLMYYVD